MPIGVYKRTEYHKKINSDCHKGLQNNLGKHWEVKDTSKMQGHPAWNKGKHIQTNNALEIYRKNGGVVWNKDIKTGFVSKTPKRTKRKNSLARLGAKHSESTKEILSEAKKDDKNPQWKGDRAGYVAMHKWVAYRKGKPHICEHCDKYVENLRHIHWANINHSYQRKLDDYIRLCLSCHRRYDSEHNNYCEKTLWKR